jgi:hypothetical protein
MSWVRIDLLFGVGLGIAGLAMAPETASSELTTLWRQVGERDGQSCAACHTADGHDVWANEFAPPDIVRRARGHMSDDTAGALMGAIGEVRQTIRYASMTRPLEPRGGVLAGENHSERDAEFGRWLATQGSRLGKGRVWTLPQARDAAESLVATPLSAVRVGIEFDLLSRDPFRPLDGMALADWLPDVGLSPEATKVFCDACDQGLGLSEIQTRVEAAAGPPKTPFEALSRAKRMALVEVFESRPMEDPSVSLPEDPVWAVGKIAVEMAEATPETLGMTVKQMEKAGVKPGEKLDFTDMARSWLWAAWTRNPSLQRIARDKNSKVGSYLLDALLRERPMPMHAAYVAARRPVEQARENPAAALQPDVNSFVNAGALARVEPRRGAPRARFRAFVADLLRMDCLLLSDDLAQGKPLANPFSARQQLGDMWDYVRPRLAARSRARTGKLVEPLLARLRQVTERKPKG